MGQKSVVAYRHWTHGGWSNRMPGKPTLWQYGLWSFQTGGTKLERFLPKIQHTQRKLLNFENWVHDEEKVSKSAKI